MSTSGPQASLTVTAVTAPPVSVVHPFRGLVLGVLGIFGFNSAPGATNNPILAGLWGLYRRYESVFEPDKPQFVSASVVSTAFTNGQTVVTWAVNFAGAQGEARTYHTVNGATGTLTANADGTYTYSTKTLGTDQLQFGATEPGSWFVGNLPGALSSQFDRSASVT
ncbi:MAG TPA: hypothetical protein VFW21_03245, partial [Mycobacterium sp.]|nr:hypothetical protein [Mycobacterium sp.]